MSVITQFGGIAPRVADHLLPPNAAHIAHNVKLRNGKLESWRERENLAYGVVDAVSLVVKGCCFLTWDACVSVADFLPDYGRMFITGRAAQPEVFTLDNCQPSYLFLGVPPPAAAPTISAAETDGRDCSARSYIYTYVNVFGEESAPSPPSRQVTVKDGTGVSITNLLAPPAGYGITQIRLYRTATAFRDGSEKEQQPLTGYLLVNTLSGTVGSTVDNKLEKFLGAANNTREVRVPPKHLRQIRHVNETSVLTGVTNNEVHFSEPYQPYNWPAAYDMTLPYHIVNMVTVDQYVIISTDGYPFVIDGGPSCEPRQCRATSQVDIPLPDIGCGYPNSAIATPFGMVYSSKDGLVLVSPDAKFQIITANWFSTDDWVELRPETVRLGYWRGYLICVTDIVSFMLEVDGQTYNDFALGALTTISDKPVDMFLTDIGELMMLEDRFISQWNTGQYLRPYLWESRELDFGGESSPNTVKIRTTDTLFRITAPTGSYYERKVINEKPVRLGRIGRHLNYRIQLSGTGTVDYVALGTMKTTVNAGR